MTLENRSTRAAPPALADSLLQTKMIWWTSSEVWHAAYWKATSCSTSLMIRRPVAASIRISVAFLTSPSGPTRPRIVSTIRLGDRSSLSANRYGTDMIDRGTGTPIVLMPGIQGRWEWLAPTVDALAERCRVITFSLCDEPSSGFNYDPSLGIENYLAQIDQAFERAGLRQAVLIGVSVQRSHRCGVRGSPPRACSRPRARFGVAAGLAAKCARTFLPSRTAIVEPDLRARFADPDASRIACRIAGIRRRRALRHGTNRTRDARFHVAEPNGDALAVDRSLSVLRCLGGRSTSARHHR